MDVRRENLDPLSEHEDHEIWRALELCQIKKVVASHPDGLSKYGFSLNSPEQISTIPSFLISYTWPRVENIHISVLESCRDNFRILVWR